ncbi:apolipo protein O-domain-containing protein [Gilbertella persicaria]|uniref:apolipo protein O-domain-containing protein n=1 Tax=Gilbertella persicaria TaxID=101096 RepID=UPI0022212259|nr:apolipo protein O-domain-containing protein [Gilbertella persicaria]KAI8054975.1 apolipo protein O-domain-containing protein [Gilbertella persicaria]
MFSPIVKRSLATAAASSAWLTATTTTVFAEEKRTKLSIYDEPEPEVVIIESPTKLEEQVFYAQKYANETLEEGKTHVNGLVEKYKQLEHQVTTNINDTIDKNEEVFPNVLYVGVAALAGTIIARNRNIVLRFLTSSTLAIGASYYLLPKTTHNVALHLEKLEHRYPQLQAAHQTVNETVGDARKQLDVTLSQFRGAVDENVSKLQEQIQQNTTQLKNAVGAAAASTSAETKDTFDQVKKNVESMYSTRSNPGVEETLKKN